MADWLGYGLDENYAEQPEIGVERKIRATSGLVRYDAKNEALDWPQAAKDAGQEPPQGPAKKSALSVRAWPAGSHM